MDTSVTTAYFLLVLFGLCRSAFIPVIKGSRQCEFYNESTCTDPQKKCPEIEVCEPDRRNHCYVVWQIDPVTQESTVALKGCFFDSQDCYDKPDCIEKSRDRKALFCCCDGDMCNQNFTWDPLPTGPPPPLPQTHEFTLVISVSLFVLFTLIIFTSLVWYYKQRKLGYLNEISNVECQSLSQSSSNLSLRSTELLEAVARGNFGTVWKAQLKNDVVAVKVSSIKFKQFWQVEQKILQLPYMNHACILQFISAEKRPGNLEMELWLVTAYHEKGSLYDYLKVNVITWSDMCRIAESMARGLEHLHHEIPASKANGYKPAIAHRDFKSENVLLNADMSACIADFGLATIFRPNKPCGDIHVQAGTRRYMAPEALEGAIDFRQNCFFRIDMYACALVLWELASRCTAHGGPVGDYKLPFQDEVGLNPTLEAMQTCVILNEKRPIIPETWRKHSGLNQLCDTIEECWDHDPDARVSAACLTRRIRYLCGNLMINSPLICIHNT